ncbi:hypothetical protein CV093_16490 [Oceanobacillus sp. 143]|nr:hypothetical protein CV093_16490 [Oceanobacillus sp. 143]
METYCWLERKLTPGKKKKGILVRMKLLSAPIKEIIRKNHGPIFSHRAVIRWVTRQT